MERHAFRSFGFSVLLGAAVVAGLSSGPTAAKKPGAAHQQQLSEIVFQNYPPQSLAAGEQGPVYFIVKLDNRAQATSCQVTHGSGFPRLDEETCRLIVNHAVFKSALNAEGRAIKSTHEGVVNWRIPGTPQPPINPIPLTAATAPEKRICKRTTKIGTLSGFERTCMTQREWDTAAAQTQEHWREQRNKGASCFETPDCLPAPGQQQPPGTPQ